jgi:hypothetical protein
MPSTVVINEHLVTVTNENLLHIDVFSNLVELTPSNVFANVHTGQRAAHARICSGMPIPAPLHPRHLRCFDQIQLRSVLMPAFLLWDNRMSNLWCMQRQQVTIEKSREAKEKGARMTASPVHIALYVRQNTIVGIAYTRICRPFYPTRAL